MSDDVTLRVGIAGYGTVGRIRHKFIDEHPKLRVVAVCDQTLEKSDGQTDGVSYWNTYEQLLAERLDMLFVCLPNYLAPVVTIAGLEQGLHVFCEKPPGRDLGDIVLVRECEQRSNGQRLMYGFNHRYHDSVRDALRIVRSRELGEIIDMRGVYGKSAIIKFDSDWRTERKLSGGGILLDQGIHMVDLMRLFVGDFEEIHSCISNDFWHHDVEDNAYALMRTTSGIVATLQSSATQWRHKFNLEITLTKGAISLSGILSSTRTYGEETITVLRLGDTQDDQASEETTRYDSDHSWRDEISQFADAVIADDEIAYGSSYEALKTMELVYKIYCADQEWSSRYGLSDASSDISDTTSLART